MARKRVFLLLVAALAVVGASVAVAQARSHRIRAKATDLTASTPPARRRRSSTWS